MTEAQEVFESVFGSEARERTGRPKQRSVSFYDTPKWVPNRCTVDAMRAMIKDGRINEARELLKLDRESQTFSRSQTYYQASYEKRLGEETARYKIKYTSPRQKKHVEKQAQPKKASKPNPHIQKICNLTHRIKAVGRKFQVVFWAALTCWLSYWVVSVLKNSSQTYNPERYREVKEDVSR